MFYIKDVNDNAPECPEAAKFYLYENRKPFTVVGVFTANDKDIGVYGLLEYQLLEKSDIFTIDRHYGLVSFSFKQLNTFFSSGICHSNLSIRHF